MWKVSLSLVNEERLSVIFEVKYAKAANKIVLKL